MKNAINLINLSGVAKSNTISEQHTLLSLDCDYRVRCLAAILAFRHSFYISLGFPQNIYADSMVQT